MIYRALYYQVRAFTHTAAIVTPCYTGLVQIQLNMLLHDILARVLAREWYTWWNTCLKDAYYVCYRLRVTALWKSFTVQLPAVYMHEQFTDYRVLYLPALRLPLTIREWKGLEQLSWPISSRLWDDVQQPWELQSSTTNRQSLHFSQTIFR